MASQCASSCSITFPDEEAAGGPCFWRALPLARDDDEEYDDEARGAVLVCGPPRK